MGFWRSSAAARAAWVLRKGSTRVNKSLLPPLKNYLATNATGFSSMIQTNSINRH
jgi:hypothetical protein